MLKICHRSYTSIHQHCNFVSYSRCFLIKQCRVATPQQIIYLTTSASSFRLQKRLQTHDNFKHDLSNILALSKLCHYVNVRRYASKGRGKKSKVFGEDDEEEFSDDEDESREDEESFSDDEMDDKCDEGGPKTWKDLSVNVSSLRIDAILSNGLGISRKKIEDAFLDARLMLNNKVMSKKSKTVKPGDVVDVVLKEKHLDREDEVPSTAVMRVKVLSIEEELTSKNRVPVKLRRWKHLEI